MPAGYAVESKPGPAAILAADLHTGQVFRSGRSDNLHRQLVGVGGQLFHIPAQLPGYGGLIQVEAKNQGRGHPVKKGAKLRSHLLADEFAAAGNRLRGCAARCRLLGANPCFCLHGSAQQFQLSGGQSAVSHGSDHLAQRLDAHISGGIQPVRRGFLVAVREDVALFVQFRHTPGEIGGGGVTGKDEYAEGFSLRRPVLGFLSGFRVADPDAAGSGVAGKLHHHGVGQNAGFLVISGSIRHGLRTGEVVLPDEYGHMAGVFGEEDAFLCGSKTAAHHKNILAGKEFTVAGGAVCHTPAPELFLSGKADHAGMCAGGQQYAEALQGAPAGLHGFDLAGHVQRRNLCQQKLCAEMLRLFAHGFGKLGAAGALHAGIVDHLGGDGDLPAEMVLFHHNHPVTGPCQIKSGSKPGRATADNDYIVEIVHTETHLPMARKGPWVFVRSVIGNRFQTIIRYSWPTKSRLGFRVSAPGCHLAGHTSSPCFATNWQA